MAATIASKGGVDSASGLIPPAHCFGARQEIADFRIEHDVVFLQLKEQLKLLRSTGTCDNGAVSLGSV